MKFTKKDRIIKRLIDGDDPEVIAREEKTSRSYVYKISSNCRTKIEQESKQIKNIDQNNADLNPEHISTKGLELTSSLGREDRKKLYRDFHDDLSDEEIIRRYGWDPIIVARERVGYYNVSRFKPHEFQNEFLIALGKPLEEVERIVNKRRLFSNSELINIIMFDFHNALNSITINYSTNPPPGWTRLKCIDCYKDIPGFIFNDSLMPYYMALMLWGSRCQNCYDRVAYLHLGQRYRYV